MGDISTPCFSIRDRLDYSPKFLTKTVRKSWICEAQLNEKSVRHPNLSLFPQMLGLGT